MLPFIAGIATGIVAVVAYKNNKKIKEQVQKGTCSVKKLAQEGLEKTKETIENVKQRLEEVKLKAQKAPIEVKAKSSKKTLPKENAK